MSWMIADLNDLRGTCYIEVLPGKFAGKCWNPESVFFEEEHFGFIEPTILRHCPEHDHYSFTDIGEPTWGKILADLHTLQQKIAGGAQLSDIKTEVDLFLTTTELQFRKLESENMNQLREMLDAFIKWAHITLDQHDSIAILGM